MDNTKTQILDSNDFPDLLQAISDPPKKLYYRGNIQLLKENLISIIGARKHSEYAPTVIRSFIPTLVKTQIVTVSGLALGIDGLVHKETLHYGGSTIAILGSGLQKISPTSHTALANNILQQNGLILSEYPDQTPAQKHYFIARNRIIAGISPTTLIIEAATKSGTRTTAEFALDEGRNVCCIPGDITRQTSYGTNILLQQGAHIILSANDLLQFYNLSNNKQAIQQGQTQRNLTAQEQRVIEQIFQEPQTIEQLLQATALTMRELLETLTALELKKHITRSGNSIHYLL